MQQSSTHPTFPDDSRIHVSLNVADLARSVDFYRALFGAEPTKQRADYAKFEPGTPRVHLSLVASHGASTHTLPGKGNLSHLGVQVSDTAAVNTARERFAKLGFAARVEDSVTCCYSVQDKVWVSDPDGNEWEVFTTLADAPDPRSGTGAACCS